MPNNLPLTETILAAQLNHLYPYLMSIAIMTKDEVINIDEYMVSCWWFIDKDKLPEARNASRLSYKSFDKYAAQNDVHCEKEFTALMPIKVWFLFTDFLQSKEKRSWNSWTKLFCYIYFNCARRSGCTFTHSREQFQKALNMQGADLSHKLITLEQAGLLIRTNYNADQGIARTYTLPENLWPDYRIYQLAKN